MFRQHNRYGYKTRVERRQQSKARREDLRDHLDRLRASGDEQLAEDLMRLKIAVRDRMGDSHRSHSKGENRPRASSAERIAEALRKLSIRERDDQKVAETIDIGEEPQTCKGREQVAQA